MPKLTRWSALIPVAIITCIALGGWLADPTRAVAATDEQVALGQELYQGTTRMTNGGPACNSCHEVTHDAVLGGGALARELTDSFSRLGEPALLIIVETAPYPAMQQAYRGRSLTEAEVVALVAFLEEADAKKAEHEAPPYAALMLGAGVVGSMLLLGLYTMIWGGRKKGSVNQEIYDRQVQSA